MILKLDSFGIGTTLHPPDGLDPFVLAVLKLDRLVASVPNCTPKEGLMVCRRIHLPYAIFYQANKPTPNVSDKYMHTYLFMVSTIHNPMGSTRYLRNRKCYSGFFLALKHIVELLQLRSFTSEKCSG